MPSVGVPPGDSGWPEAFSSWTDLNWPTPESTLNSQGSFYYVNALGGSDSNDGTSWDTALLTMNAAFDKLVSGDTIFFHGKIREQLTTPDLVFDVTVVGAGNRPRHADTHAGGAGGESAATWTVPASDPATAPLCIVQHQGWRFMNMVFAGPTDASCVQLLRAGTPDTANEQDASHAEFRGCRFASGLYGLEDSGGCYNVGIFDNTFNDTTDFAIKHTSGAGIAACYRWEIKRNRFDGCAKWIDTFNPHAWEIMDNTVLEITTPGVNTSGGDGHNVVVGNKFDIAAADFDPNGGFTSHATDVWSNTLTNSIETGLPAN